MPSAPNITGRRGPPPPPVSEFAAFVLKLDPTSCIGCYTVLLERDPVKPSEAAAMIRDQGFKITKKSRGTWVDGTPYVGFTFEPRCRRR